MVAQSAAPAARVSFARDSGRALAGTILSNLSNVVIIVLLARFLGGEEVGEYTLGFAVRALLVLVCGLGMRAAMTRFVATFAARGEPGTVRGAVLIGLLAPLALSIVVAVGWFAASEWLATDVFGDEDLTVPLRIFALSLPLFVLSDTALAATQGFLTMGPYTWIGQILEPGLRVILTAGVLIAGYGVTASVYALLAASAVGAIAAIIALAKLLRGLDSGPVHAPWAELSGFASLSWIASMATQGLLWADIVILGALVSSAEVGTYQVAARVVLIATVSITPLTASMAGRVASRWEVGDTDGVTGRYLAIVLWASRLSFPLLAGVAAVPSAVLAIFGDDFAAGRTVILLLVAGAMAEALGAPSSVLLNQIGRNKLNMTINVTGLVTNSGLNFALIPSLGINGAAIAWAVTLMSGAVARVLAVRMIVTARWPWGRELLAALAGSGLAFGLAAVATRPIERGSFLQLVVAVPVVLFTYLAWVALFGVNREERSLASRTISLRLPWLRQAIVRWRLRGAGSSDEAIRLVELVSPFRVDVLARSELFQLARSHADLLAADFDAFVALARDTKYGDWFEEIVIKRDNAGGQTEIEQARTFRAIVRASLQLLARSDSDAPSNFAPVTVTKLVAGTELNGWRLGSDRWVLLDGGHRVALAMQSGATELPPGSYLVVADEMPPNNTRRMLAAGRLSAEDAVGFIAAGLVPAQFHGEVHTWSDLLEHVSDADREAMLTWPEASVLSDPR